MSMFFSLSRTYHNFCRSSHDLRRSSEAFQLRPKRYNKRFFLLWIPPICLKELLKRVMCGGPHCTSSCRRL
ncbi:hypothetical protein HanXRQr2_Chr05g0237611 [Helianthus annuus]|uniref:Uncharacterized protein n=1 Tax=Helianthus annuus TaxID=4232 RepID=A0A9K3J3P8_HELAN|nr:hypothetical protein HanXRQr2_Chr05g0237611 [Helianthus annuus]